MSVWVPPEIGESYDGKLALIGRDPGRTEVEKGRPFVGSAGRLLNEALGVAGIRRRDCIVTNVCGRRPPGNNFQSHDKKDLERGKRQLRSLLKRHSPNLVVAFGNEAAYTLLPDRWPTRSEGVFGAKGIYDRRGYIWCSEAFGGVKVLTAVHPAALLHGGSTRGMNALIGKMLLYEDMKRAKDEAEFAEVRRPKRDTIVVRDERRLDEIRDELRSSPLVGCDIETEPWVCYGFAPTPQKTYVFPARLRTEALKLMADPKIHKVFQNGQFDAYYILTRDDVRVRGWTDDTQIQFHALWPEVAGKTGAGSGNKRTHKSLHFLASLYTNDPWWKTGGYVDEYAFYKYNARDCAVTLDIAQQQNKLIDARKVRAIYEHEMRLIWPLIECEKRGLRVDEGLRRKRLTALEERLESQRQRLAELVEPLLEARRDRLEKPHLFWETKTCDCCRNGSAKREKCWGCAGFEKSPSKADLEATFGNPEGLLKADLAAKVLQPCTECEARGQWEEFSGFNPDSNDQKRDVLFNVLRVPKRASVDEETLKNLRGAI